MIDAAIWIEIATAKILLRQVRGQLFLLGRFELFDLPALKLAMTLHLYNLDGPAFPRASRALGFIGGDPRDEGDFGALNKWGMN